MEPKVYRGYGALRVGRSSESGANYFVTGCLKRPLTGLTNPVLARIVQTKLHKLDSAGHWHIRTFVIMPDHFHLFLTLGEASTLSEALRLFKGRLAPILRTHGFRWQENFYDHRLRSGSDLLSTFLYIFLNPYRAGLIPSDKEWPWYFCAPDDWAWFGDLTNASVPFPEWLL